MRPSPRYIIFIAVSRYLTQEQIAKIKDDLGKENPKQDRKFLTILKRYFDFEKMRTHPYIWQDIWIYNYLLYDFRTKFTRHPLINKYEREIIKPSEMLLKEYLELLS